MTLKGLEKDTLKLILFGGKGGVGKTTCALASALYLAESFKTLVISTDPAHSISDGLGQKIGDVITEVKGVRNLSALEVCAEKALSQFKKRYEAQIKRILDTSTYLDEEDIDSFFSLPIPGMDEVMGFKTIVDLIEEAKFDKYIVDTAPTGHALRLLSLPELLDDWIKALAKMRWKYRYMVTSFGGKYSPDEGDDFLVEMKRTVKRIEELLKNSQRCEFIAVTIPEEMAYEETERLIKSLCKYGMKVKQLVINNVLKSREPCKFCSQRRDSQLKYVKKIKDKFWNLRKIVIPLQPGEVRGLEALEEFRKLLV